MSARKMRKKSQVVYPAPGNDWEYGVIDYVSGNEGWKKSVSTSDGDVYLFVYPEDFGEWGWSAEYKDGPELNYNWGLSSADDAKDDADEYVRDFFGVTATRKHAFEDEIEVVVTGEYCDGYVYIEDDHDGWLSCDLQLDCWGDNGEDFVDYSFSVKAGNGNDAAIEIAQEAEAEYGGDLSIDETYLAEQIDFYFKSARRKRAFLDEFDVAGTPYTLKIDGMSVIVTENGREVGVVNNAGSLSEYKLVGAISKQIDMPRDDFEREMMQDALFDAVLDVIDYLQSGDIFSYARRNRFANHRKGFAMRKRSGDMSRWEILDVIEQLSHSQGFYARLYDDLMFQSEVDPDGFDELMTSIEEYGISDPVDLVMFIEGRRVGRHGGSRKHAMNKKARRIAKRSMRKKAQEYADTFQYGFYTVDDEFMGGEVHIEDNEYGVWLVEIYGINGDSFEGYGTGDTPSEAAREALLDTGLDLAPNEESDFIDHLKFSMGERGGSFASRKRRRSAR